jgi:SAM-dependent methyltransferase
MKPVRLNLGCGHAPIPGWVNIDKFPGFGVDIVTDLNASNSLPFGDATVTEIRAYALLEHLLNWENLMIECARVLMPGGTLDIRVPNGHVLELGFVPYHVRAFGQHSFDAYRSDYLRTSFDLTRSKPDYGSLEYAGLQWFTLVKQCSEHFYPFAWHLARSLGNWVYRLPLARATMLQFILRRNDAPKL